MASDRAPGGGDRNYNLEMEVGVKVGAPWVPRTQASSAPTAPPAASHRLPFFVPLPAVDRSLRDALVLPSARGSHNHSLAASPPVCPERPRGAVDGLAARVRGLLLSGGQIPMERLNVLELLFTQDGSGLDCPRGGVTQRDRFARDGGSERAL